jgi:Regulator of chromosome condensation (RCC1) repeat
VAQIIQLRLLTEVSCTHGDLTRMANLVMNIMKLEITLQNLWLALLKKVCCKNRGGRGKKKSLTMIETVVCHVAIGGSHMAAVAQDGSVWTWGNNDYAQLGREGYACSHHPIYRITQRTAGGTVASQADWCGLMVHTGWARYHSSPLFSRYVLFSFFFVLLSISQHK